MKRVKSDGPSQHQWRAMTRAKQTQRRPAAARGPFMSIMIAGLAILLAWWWPTARSPQASEQNGDRFFCQVMSVTDGDTLRCADGTRVRLHAVAARESDESCSPGHPCPSASGAAATATLRELAGGQGLQCMRTGTSYNRVTAICSNEAGVEVNCAMIQSGTVVIWPRYNSAKPICQR